MLEAERGSYEVDSSLPGDIYGALSASTVGLITLGFGSKVSEEIVNNNLDKPSGEKLSYFRTLNYLATEVPHSLIVGEVATFTTITASFLLAGGTFFLARYAYNKGR
jgi:hypothetical protein